MVIMISIHAEDPVELPKHETEYTRRNTERGAENDANIPHRHLVVIRILDNQNQVGR
jgi:hypothetical protein